MSLPITLSTKSRIVAFGSVQSFEDANPGEHGTAVQAELLDGTSPSPVARTNAFVVNQPDAFSTATTDGVLYHTTPLGGIAPYDAAPGTYTLRLRAGNSGFCADLLHYDGIALSYQTIPTP